LSQIDKSAITQSEVFVELSRLLESDELRRAPSHQRLLKYLVERASVHGEEVVPESTIAIEVFRRDPSTYDSQADPIVRVNMGRLRDRVARHYANLSHSTGCQIQLPAGAYRVTLSKGIRKSETSRSGIAILTTKNHSEDDELTAMCATLSEHLIDALALLGQMRVVSRGSVASLEQLGKSLSEVGDSLKVMFLLEPVVVVETASRIRLSLRLLNAENLNIVWTETATDAKSNRFQLMDRAVDKVLTHFASDSQQAEMISLAKLSEFDREKIETARHLINHLTVESIDRAIKLARELTGLYPSLADAWVLRARALVRRANYGDLPFSQLIPEIRLACENALKVEARNSYALAIQALLIAVVDFDVVRAEEQFKNVLSAAPNLPMVRMHYALILTATGRFDDALRELAIAKSFDPISMNLLCNLAFTHYYARDYQKSRAAWHVALESGGPALFPLLGAGITDLMSGNEVDALRYYSSALESFPHLAMAHMGMSYYYAHIGDLKSSIEMESVAVAIGQKTGGAGVHALSRAIAASLREDKRATLEWLEAAKSQADIWLIATRVEPCFLWLHNDADFKRVLKRMGIPLKA
jgi:TolB-like protein/Tfp pilus assembly protein PilF